jgi:Mn-containing catalase
MWIYEKKLQYPVNITKKDLPMAKYLLTQFGGANGELGACIRYLSQRYTLPTEKGRALLTDIGTEEPAPFCCRCYNLSDISKSKLLTALESHLPDLNFL